MKIKTFFSILFILIVNIGFSESFLLDAVYTNYQFLDNVVNVKTNSFDNSIFQLLDGNKETGVLFNTNSAIPFSFSKTTGVDAIVLTDGLLNQSNQNTQRPRIKTVRVLATKNDEAKTVVFNHLYEFDPDSESISAKKIIRLGESVYADKIQLIVSDLLQFKEIGSPICYLYEVEFYHNGSKLEIADLEKTKDGFRKQYLDYKLTGLKQRYDSVRLIEFQGDPAALATRWKSLGVDIDSIYTKFSESGGYQTYIQFQGFDSKTGPVYLGRKGQGLAANKSDGNGRKTLINPVQIGSWKLDDNGVLWIRIGKGEWKGDYSDFLFIGTDLGVLAMSSSI